MIYATLDDFARVAFGGWTELAQRATGDARISGLLMETLAHGADVSGWPPEEVERAQAGLQRLSGELERTSRHADTFIVPRYSNQPISPDVVAASDLPTVVATIALRRLYGAEANEEMRKNTAWADRYLVDLSQGRASLGLPDVQGQDPETYYQFSARSVTDDDLAGY